VPDLLVDTSGFYAVADRSDAHHEEAREVFEARGAKGELVTTDHIVVETWMLLRARLSRAAAMRYWDAILAGAVTVLGVAGVELAGAHRIGAGWPDQDFSLVDLTSFATMERRGILEVLAFGDHFRIYRFGAGRRRAFRVLP
jgi:predicted nucleic acid-binding protein